MSPFLLDTNVLIALIDSTHVRHHDAHTWFENIGHKAWATCPLTENGLLRIVSHAHYPNSLGTPSAAMNVVSALRQLQGHSFWPDDITLFDAQRIHHERLLSSAHLTDTYLLALAVKHEGRLATFDRRLVTNAVISGSQALQVL